MDKKKDTKFSFVFVQTLKKTKSQVCQKQKLASGKRQPYEHRLGQFACTSLTPQFALHVTTGGEF